MSNERITMASGVNREGKPFVQYAWEGELRKAQWTPDECRQHALALLAVAEAAEHDAAVFNWVLKEFGMVPEQAAQIVADLRNYRAGMGGAKP